MAARKEPGAEEFGRLLTARRHELGLSRREVADASGLSYPYVSQLETGYRLPSHKAIAALADALELDPGELSASIPYGEALASSDVRSSRSQRSARSREGWHANPQYQTVEASAAPRPADAEEVARQIADLVRALPRGERLDALHLAQREVTEHLVAEEVAEERRVRRGGPRR
jgi:transcriptional regulator with XRE-family HTH domain